MTVHPQGASGCTVISNLGLPLLVASFINGASREIKEPLRSLWFASLIPALRRYELSQ